MYLSILRYCSRGTLIFFAFNAFRVQLANAVSTILKLSIMLYLYSTTAGLFRGSRAGHAVSHQLFAVE